MTVQNNGSVTATVTPTVASLSLSNPSLASCSASPSPASLTLAAGHRAFYMDMHGSRLAASGSLTFSNSVRDSGNCLFSQWATSNAVLIGPFTAALSVTRTGSSPGVP